MLLLQDQCILSIQGHRCTLEAERPSSVKLPIVKYFNYCHIYLQKKERAKSASDLLVFSLTGNR
jgi:hypothetical protein